MTPERDCLTNPSHLHHEMEMMNMMTMMVMELMRYHVHHNDYRNGHVDTHLSTTKKHSRLTNQSPHKPSSSQGTVRIGRREDLRAKVPCDKMSDPRRL